VHLIQKEIQGIGYGYRTCFQAVKPVASFLGDHPGGCVQATQTLLSRRSQEGFIRRESPWRRYAAVLASKVPAVDPSVTAVGVHLSPTPISCVHSSSQEFLLRKSGDLLAVWACIRNAVHQAIPTPHRCVACSLCCPRSCLSRLQPGDTQILIAGIVGDMPIWQLGGAGVKPWAGASI